MKNMITGTHYSGAPSDLLGIYPSKHDSMTKIMDIVDGPLGDRAKAGYVTNGVDHRYSFLVKRDHTGAATSIIIGTRKYPNGDFGIDFEAGMMGGRVAKLNDWRGGHAKHKGKLHRRLDRLSRGNWNVTSVYSDAELLRTATPSGSTAIPPAPASA